MSLQFALILVPMACVVQTSGRWYALYAVVTYYLDASASPVLLGFIMTIALFAMACQEM